MRQEEIRTVSSLLRKNVRSRGDRLAFADDHRRVTWGELGERTARIATGLGVERGDRVAFLLGNSVELVEYVLGTVRAAAIGVPLSPHSTDAELAALLADCAPAVLVTDESHLAQARRVTAGRPETRLIAAGAEPPPDGTPRDDLGLDEPAFMLYTSGTTGAAKGAVSTQRAALWSAFACYQPVLRMTADDHLLWPLPLAHSFAHSFCVLGVTVAGASARIAGEPGATHVARLIAEESPTVVAGVPAVYRQLLDGGPIRGSSLRMCLTAGAVSDPALRADVEALFGAPLLDCYGTTETCGMIAVERVGSVRAAGSSGPPAPGVEVRLVDPVTGAEAAAGGEIWVRGPNLMLGYHQRPEVTADVLVDGWYRTGDLGRLDAGGNLSVVGRVSDVIIRGGLNVDPAEVELALIALPEVADAAVVARPHPLLGEVPVAFVVTTGELGDPHGLLRGLDRVLSAHKVPEEIIQVPVIPRTPSGKPRRHLLRETFTVEPGPVVPADLVHAEITALCGPFDDPGTAFADLGMTSMGAMTVWNRLSRATGLRLPATLLWDHPSPSALITYLENRLADEPVGGRSLVARAATEPIAIVAVGCRYPGGVRTPDDLWRLVADGVDATGDFPADRGWDPDLYDPDPDRIGRSSTRRGGFLYDAADFDPAFFGISPKEALAADPQHRLLLEVAWETFERAGIAAPSLRDSDTGVFLGLMHGGYGPRGDAHELESHLGIGSAGSIAPGRIAYLLGLRGPAMTIDTACSSSLVAMDLAAKALRAGECSLALAGGATVMASAQSFVMFSRQRGLAPDGRCRSFAAGADGTAWGEGAGLVLLERLDDALRNGHPVLAVLRGSAVNSDGASNGLTAPNGGAQRELIGLALADAGLGPADVDVIEGHGTGTRIGDPIEANALLDTYGKGRDLPVWLGSVKSNLGHTQAAAGIAGVIKMIEAMRHGEMPRSLYAEDPSPRVDWDGGALRLLDTARPWPAGDRPRRAAVSAFGLGGTNAHVIIEEPPPADIDGLSPAGVTVDVQPGGWDHAPWLIGGADEAGLRAHAARLADLPHGRDTAFSLATGRAPLGVRAAVRGGDRDGLAALAAGVPHRSVHRAPTRRDPQLSFLFTGQGAQRIGMGRELAAAFPDFARVYDRVCAAFRPHLDRPLPEVIGTELLHRTDHAQPAMFAFEVALHALYEACGVRPRRLAGHSIGELAAAYVAGVFSLDDAARLVAARGRLMAALPGGGAMIAVRAGEDEVVKLLADSGGPMSIAAVNGPDSVVISGAEAAVTELAGRLDGRYDRLRVSHAFHSPLMEPMLDDFRVVAESVAYHRPSIPLVVSGDPGTADYWVRHVRDTVRFADTMAGLDASAYVEIGPAAVLSVLAERCVTADAFVPGVVGPAGFLDGLATLHVHGVPVDWARVYAGSGARRRDLPTYPFQRQRYWLSSTSASHSSPSAGEETGPMIGGPRADADGPRIRYSGVLSTNRQPWLADHVIGDDLIVPAAALLELAFQAAPGARITELSLDAPLLVSTSPSSSFSSSDVQVVVDGDRLTIWARPTGSADPWTGHATAVLATASGHLPEAPAVWPPDGAEPVAVDYGRLAERGFHYGPAFRGVTAVWRGNGEMYAEITLPSVDTTGYLVHPALLDAALHASLLAEPPDRLRVPFVFGGVERHGAGVGTARVVLTPLGPDEVRVTVTDRAGRPIVTIASLVTRAIDIQDAVTRRSLHRLSWVPAPGAPGETPIKIITIAGTAGSDVPSRARHLLGETLALVNGWLDTDRPERLVVVTERATGPDPDPAAAAVWGLLGSAVAEHPGRISAVDLCGAPESAAALEQAAALAEPRLAVRNGLVLAPRLIPSGAADAVPPVLAGGTVLVTGGTGALGAVLSRHLSSAYGVRRLVLVNRTGHVPQWVEDLDVDVTVTACDVGDRAAVEALIASCGPELIAVFHLAGVLDDGVLTAMTPARIDAVLAPKADAAWHLHEATRDLDLAAFVLYSSASGMLARPGQANYAAANAFVDAVAAHRAAIGLPAQSLAWGLWATESGGMPDRVTSGAARRYLTGGGIHPISESQGMALLARSLRTAATSLAPIAFAAPTPESRDGALSPASSFGVSPFGVPAPGPASHGPRDWRHTLAALPESDRPEALARLIHAEIAELLGFPDPSAADLSNGRHLADLGFDSLAAIQLRDRLGTMAGVRLKATLVFDHPTLEELTAHVYESLPAPDPLPPSPGPIASPPVSPSPGTASSGRAFSPTAAALSGPSSATDRFTAIYHRVIRERGPAEAMALRYLASYGLPTFSAEELQDHTLAPVRLTNGTPDQPLLIFLPGYLALHDPAPTALARAFDGDFDMCMLVHPGFGNRRAVPDSVLTLARAHADTVRSLSAERTFYLVGDSAGGLVAHAVATALFADGTPPAGIILIDSHLGGRDDPRALALVAADRRRPAELFHGVFADTTMIAGGAYVRIFEDWHPEPFPPAQPQPLGESLPELAGKSLPEPVEASLPELFGEGLGKPVEASLPELFGEGLGKPVEASLPELFGDGLPEPVEASLSEPVGEGLSEPVEVSLTEPVGEGLREPVEESRFEAVEGRLGEPVEIRRAGVLDDPLGDPIEGLRFEPVVGPLPELIEDRPSELIEDPLTAPSEDRRAEPDRVSAAAQETAGVPTLLLRAAPTREMREADPDRDWSPHWPLPHATVDIPGDHWTTTTTDAPTTANAIRHWLSTLATPAGPMG
ncbi:beta-ketoacyl synthase N-terminal-like domain-containing protein [Actinoplanes sp. G11-F43]|uniref:beta-ketoacyl synthase N-terminal-like domain-containing protein n=1 Tax=Actinoplanes sp. G11-F43 TaxID=3424130 RepID=UPI003D337871